MTKATHTVAIAIVVDGKPGEAFPIASTVTLAMGRDSGVALDVPLADIMRTQPALAAEFLSGYVRQRMGDAQALPKGIDATPANKKAACEKVLDAWLAGEFHVKGGGGDSIEGEVKRIILARVAKSRGIQPTDVGGLAKLGREEAFKGRGYELVARIARQKAEAANDGTYNEADLSQATDAYEAVLRAELINAAKAAIADRAEAAKRVGAKLDMTSIADLF